MIKLPLHYDLTGKYSFGHLSKETLDILFSDGRVASHFLSKEIENIFTNLKYVDQRGYDFVDINTGQRYEFKCFTKGGCKFSMSNMIGKGRKLNHKVMKEFITENKLQYILCDIINFPLLNIQFIDGMKLSSMYSKFSIPFKDREKIFNVQQTLPTQNKNLPWWT